MTDILASSGYYTMVNFLSDHQLISAIITALIIFLAFWLFSRLITNYILTWAQNLARKNRLDFWAKIFEALQEPLRIFFIGAGFCIAVIYLPFPATYEGTINNIMRSLVIIFIAWCLLRMTDYMSQFPDEIKDRFNLDKILIPFLNNAIKFIMIALAIVIIAQEWDYNVNGFIAGLGLGGLAFALAAQNFLANLFGGMIIVTEKPFSLGDWIKTPSVEGAVEEITFRSTRIRAFDQAYVTVPNSTLANEPITNYTRIGKRRLNFHLGVTYNTSINKLETCVERIKQLLKQHPDIYPDTIGVYFEKFGDSSLDIYVDSFTRTTLLSEFLAIKNEINFMLMKILAEEQVSLAFPSQSIYVENLPEKNAGRPDGEE
ncbi:MAG TPA: mechanosensitive ion channel family protein [Syntrophomonadaceae bacterium]|nr:mechanosensitive ion channel family protein [Syntrophomonadaceae bacterium]HPR93559.1 mechanosensitive ion channel family protein [Syntrophomonadaceae bacterium]